MTDKNVEIIHTEEWQIEMLRLTAFQIPPSSVSNPEWWKIVTGEEPEIVSSRLKEGTHAEEGPFCNGKLVNQIKPNRIDWLLTSGREQKDLGSMVVGPFSETLKAFLSLMSKWLGSATCPTVYRLAFGAVLLLPVGSLSAGYKKLVPLLPSVELKTEKASDFMYQINRPRNSHSGVPGMEINRLSKWSVATTFGVGFWFSPKGVETTHREEEQFACRLEIDINTRPSEYQPLPKEKSNTLLEELAELGKEIATKGDIP